MSEWDVRLDPVEVATARTELDLQSAAISVADTGIDWGDAAIASFLADQKYGSTPVDFRVPNRVVTIPLGLGMGDFTQSQFDAARVALHQKVALIQRERGWLKRARTGVKMYADVVNATLHEPDVWGATGGVEDGVVLTLECSPDFYGDEVTLDAITGTGRALSTLKSGGTQATITGDYPARCRLIVSDTSGNQQKGVLWGVRSQHYDSASTAALFYEAESMTGLNGAASAARAGASGGNTMKITSVPYQSGGLWVPMMLTDVSGSQLTHQGSYRVWARVYATDAGSSLRLQWGSGSLAAPTTNDPTSIPGTGAFYLVDLGTIRIDATPVTGTASWQGVFQVCDPNGNGTFEIDTVIFQPVDESSGRENAITVASPTIVTAANPSGTFSDDASAGSAAWGVYGPVWLSQPSGVGALTHYLKFSSLGFSIPAGATIMGIKAAVNRGASRYSASSDNTIRLIKAGVLVGNNKATGVTWPTSPATAIYGGSGDLWGTTWSPTDINNAGFGLEVQAVSLTNASLSIDVWSVTITVYYKLSAGFTVAQDVVIDANGSCEIRTEGAFRPDPAAGSWGNVSQEIGDLPRLPPSGLEGRAVELLVRNSRGDVGDDPVTSQDSALDALSVTVKYRPCYLLRP